MDHADEPGRRAMQARERELLAAHHGPLAADPWAAVAAEAAAEAVGSVPTVPRDPTEPPNTGAGS
jgi:hypothetical protein